MIQWSRNLSWVVRLRFVNFVLVVGGVVDPLLQELSVFGATSVLAGALSALLVIRFEVLVCSDPLAQKPLLGVGLLRFVNFVLVVGGVVDPLLQELAVFGATSSLHGWSTVGATSDPF